MKATTLLLLEKGSWSKFAFYWKSALPFLVSTIAICLTGTILLYLIHIHQNNQLDRLMVDAHRDYRLMPFDIMDARDFCRKKMERKYGNSLALAYVDEHSTRQDTRSGIFKIFMFARVGTLNEFEEEVVHCFIDPERQELTHFRTINLNKASLMSRAMKFFQ